MAKIKLSESTFTVIPEGEYTFKIVGVDYKQDFDKLEVKCEIKNGQKHTERFTLNNENGIKAFTYFAKSALNDWTLEEVDPDELLGCYFNARVEHVIKDSTKEEGKTVTFVQLKDKSAVDPDFKGWTSTVKTVDTETGEVEEVKAEDDDEFDLDDILG